MTIPLQCRIILSHKLYHGVFRWMLSRRKDSPGWWRFRSTLYTQWRTARRWCALVFAANADWLGDRLWFFDSLRGHLTRILISDVRISILHHLIKTWYARQRNLFQCWITLTTFMCRFRWFPLSSLPFSPRLSLRSSSWRRWWNFSQ